MKKPFPIVVNFLLSSLLVASHGPIRAAQADSETAKTPVLTATVDQVLNKVHTCRPSLSFRTQAMSEFQLQQACQQLGQLEQQFHQVFSNSGLTDVRLAPVRHDHNTSLRANIYQSHADYVKYAGLHFNMPTDNGGMYLEGLPEQSNNHAEFIAYQREQGQVHNLGHEYVHYLDGRFNLYGDFCANLHDSHSAPENCAQPSPNTPYLVWWTEGIAEYIARGTVNPNAYKVLHDKTEPVYVLSQLFDTGYETNHGRSRIYAWGYLATRYMMEKQRDKVEKMLSLTRIGDYPRYQALVRSWGPSMDADFAAWWKAEMHNLNAEQKNAK